MCNSVSAIPRDVSNSRGFKPVECIGPLRDPVRMPLLRTWSLSFQILEASQMQVLFFKGVQEAGTNRRQGIPKYGRLYAGVGPSLPSRE